MRIKLSKIIDTALTLTIFFVIAVLWFRYYSFGLTQSILYALICALAVTAVIEVIFKRKTAKKQLSEEEKQRINNAITQLSHLGTEACVDFFHRLLEAKYKTVTKTDRGIIIDGNARTIVIPKFLFRGLNRDDIAECYAVALNYPQYIQNVIILTTFLDKSAKGVACSISGRNVRIMQQAEVYGLLKETDTYPRNVIQISVKKPKTITALLSISLNRKRVKSYLFASLFLVLASFVMRYTLYYRLWASILLILAFISARDINFSPDKPQNDFKL